MGCKTSKTKTAEKTDTGGGSPDAGGGPKSNTRKRPNNAGEPNQSPDAHNNAVAFLKMVNEDKHPVARELLNEWTIFVDAQEQKVSGNPAAAEAYKSRPMEVWAQGDEPVSHRSVDQVGKMFLAYIGDDLTQRGWGGKFNYQVKGVAKEGFVSASADVEPVISEAPEEVKWEFKVRYKCQT